METKKEKIVMVSGGFDPVHFGHVKMFQEAKKLGDKLIVVVNCDAWLQRKKGRAFMDQEHRAAIIRELRPVDEVYILESDHDHVCEALEKFRPHVFANGGDRRSDKDIPESQVCRDLGIEMIFNVGGDKVQSSSNLLKAYHGQREE
jgi:cytidyltransferase-like protein